VFHVVNTGHSRVVSLQQFHSPFQVSPAVTQDLPRNSRYLNCLGEDFVDSVAGRLFHGDQAQQREIGVPQWSTVLHPDAQPHAHDDQALVGSQLERVIHDPCPVIRMLLRTAQFVEPEA
jgi:hypothetical protein